MLSLQVSNPPLGALESACSSCLSLLPTCLFSAPTLCPTGLAHLGNNGRPLDVRSGGMQRPGLSGAWAQEDGKSGSLKEDENSLSEMKSESAWQRVPLPPPPWGPSHTLGLSSELYISPSWTRALAESPSINSLRSPALAQTSGLVRRDEDKPASGPHQDLCSRRTGAVGAG